MFFKLITLTDNTEVGRWPHEAQTVRQAELLAGAPLHWSTDKTTLLNRNGVAAFKVVKVGFKGGEGWKATASMADDVRGCPMGSLVESIKWLHTKDEWQRRDIYLLEVERQVQNALRLEGHVGLSPDQWAEALGITTRHQDCEGLQAFNHAFERRALHGAIRMLECNGGGSPPTTDQYLDREASGEWYPRACK